MNRAKPLREAAREGWSRLRGGELSPPRAGASVAIGLFVGCLPLYGLQTFICLLFTVPLRLDFPLAWVATNVANPITAPLLIVLEIELGSWLCSGAWTSISPHDVHASNLGAFLFYALLGGATLGAGVALLGGAATLAWMRRRRARASALAHSMTRTPST